MKLSRFTSVAIVLTVVIGVASSVLLYRNTESFTLLKEKYAETSNLVLNSDRDLYQALQAQYILMSSELGSDAYKDALTGYDENFGQVKERMTEAFGLLHSKSIDSLKPIYEESLNKWDADAKTLNSLLESGAGDSVVTSHFEDVALKDFKAIREKIDVMNDLIDFETNKYVEESSNISFLTIWFFVGIIVIDVLLLFYLASKIKKPIQEIVGIANAMSDGNFSNTINTNLKGEVGDLAHSFSKLKTTIESLNGEISKLKKAGEQGNLDVRADASIFRGEFNTLITGLNNTLDAIIKPLNVAAEYVDRISKGDMPPKIRDDYQGDFNEIKNNLNLCIDSINFLILDTKSLINSATLGKLSERADANKHFGEYKNIILGINSAFDRLVGLIDNMPLPVQIVDTEYNLLYANKQAELLNK